MDFASSFRRKAPNAMGGVAPAGVYEQDRKAGERSGDPNIALLQREAPKFDYVAARDIDSESDALLRAAAARNMRGEGAASAKDLGTLYNQGEAERGENQIYGAGGPGGLLFRKNAGLRASGQGQINAARSNTTNTMSFNNQRAMLDAAKQRADLYNTGVNQTIALANQKQERANLAYANTQTEKARRDADKSLLDSFFDGDWF